MKLSLVKDSQSESHIIAVKMEADLCSSRRGAGIGTAFQPVVLAVRLSSSCTS